MKLTLDSQLLMRDIRYEAWASNDMFCDLQVIVNKSRAKFRTMVWRIPIQIDDIEKISPISEHIKSMLRSHSIVFLGKEAPYCFLSHIERSYAELTFGCNLKQVVSPLTRL